jgi:hypothetical protein
MELHPDAVIGRIDYREGVTAESVHVAEALRDPAVGHDDGNLVKRLGQQGPKIPIVIRTVSHPLDKSRAVVKPDSRSSFAFFAAKSVTYPGENTDPGLISAGTEAPESAPA